MTQLSIHPLARIMQDRELTQEQVALLLGFSQQRVSELLRLTKHPSQPLIDRICKKLAISADELVDSSGGWKATNG